VQWLARPFLHNHRFREKCRTKLRTEWAPQLTLACTIRTKKRFAQPPSESIFPITPSFNEKKSKKKVTFPKVSPQKHAVTESGGVGLLAKVQHRLLKLLFQSPFLSFAKSRQSLRKVSFCVYVYVALLSNEWRRMVCKLRLIHFVTLKCY